MKCLLLYVFILVLFILVTENTYSLEVYGLFPLSNIEYNDKYVECAAAAYLAALNYNITLKIINTKNDLTYTLSSIKNFANSSTLFIGPYNSDIARQIYLMYQPKLILTYGNPIDRLYLSSINNTCNMAPEFHYQAQAIMNIASYYKWENVAILSDVDSSLILSALDQSSELNNIQIAHYGIFHSENTLNNAIKGILSKNCRIIILHCSTKWVNIVLKAANALNVNRYKGYVWLVTSNIIDSISQSNDELILDLSLGMIGVRFRYHTFENNLWQNNYESLQNIFNTTFSKSIHDHVSYAYDSIQSIYLAHENNKLLNNHLNSLDFNGVTDHVTFDTSCYRIPSFDIVNIKQQNNIDYVGQWYATSTLISNNDAQVIINGDINFFGKQSQIPSDRFEAVVDLNTSVVWLTITLVILGFLFSLGISYSVYRYAEDAYIKATAPVLTQVMVFGTFVMYISVLVWTTAKATFLSCHLPPLLWGVAFSCTILTLSLKSLRIYAIFFGKLKQKSGHLMKDVDIIKWVLLNSFIDILFWCILYGISPATKIKVYSTSSASVFCQFSNTSWIFISIIIIVPKFVIFITGLILSFRIRYVPNNFNESKLMALTIFFQVIIYGVVALLYLLLRTVDRNAAHLVVAFGLCIAMMTLLFIHNFPRLYTVRQKKRRLRSTSLYRVDGVKKKKKPTRQDIVSYSRRHVRCLNCGTPVNKDYIKTLLNVMEDPSVSPTFDLSRNRAASAPDKSTSDGLNEKNEHKSDFPISSIEEVSHNNNHQSNSNNDQARLWPSVESTTNNNDSEIFLSDTPFV